MRKHFKKLSLLLVLALLLGALGACGQPASSAPASVPASAAGLVCFFAVMLLAPPCGPPAPGSAGTWP